MSRSWRKLLASVDGEPEPESLGHESIEITLRYYVTVLPTQQEQVRGLGMDVFG